MEHLPDEEQPPRHIWWSDELVSDWFTNVKNKRKRDASGKRSSYDDAQDVPMNQNELIDRSGPYPVLIDQGPDSD